MKLRIKLVSVLLFKIVYLKRTIMFKIHPLKRIFLLSLFAITPCAANEKPFTITIKKPNYSSTSPKNLVIQGLVASISKQQTSTPPEKVSVLIAPQAQCATLTPYYATKASNPNDSSPTATQFEMLTLLLCTAEIVAKWVPSINQVKLNNEGFFASNTNILLPNNPPITKMTIEIPTEKDKRLKPLFISLIKYYKKQYPSTYQNITQIKLETSPNTNSFIITAELPTSPAPETNESDLDTLSRGTLFLGASSEILKRCPVNLQKLLIIEQDKDLVVSFESNDKK